MVIVRSFNDEINDHERAISHVLTGGALTGGSSASDTDGRRRRPAGGQSDPRSGMLRHTGSPRRTRMSGTARSVDGSSAASVGARWERLATRSSRPPGDPGIRLAINPGRHG